MVPEDDRRGSLSDRGHVVADGDRDDPDHAAPGRHHHEAGIRDTTVSGDRRGGRRRKGPARPREQGRLSRDQEALARHAQTLYKDPERYKQVYWSQVPGKYFT